jgi:hypothetical protein
VARSEVVDDNPTPPYVADFPLRQGEKRPVSLVGKAMAATAGPIRQVTRRSKEARRAEDT